VLADLGVIVRVTADRAERTTILLAGSPKRSKESTRGTTMATRYSG
jgi:hypothetical protein